MTSDHATASTFLPARLTPGSLERAARVCTGCDLHHLGTQTVFGEGPVPAALMLVGEQPGDREDREGRPFVGPAGALLDRALTEAGVDRDEVYLTNAVKHFRWEGMRGKRRLHRKPSMAQIGACRPWLDAEISIVRPEILVCLGATAAQAILGRSFRLTRHRGELLDAEGLRSKVVATVHPASILRGHRRSSSRGAALGIRRRPRSRGERPTRDARARRRRMMRTTAVDRVRDLRDRKLRDERS
jgi:uracil-DNA glycosylase family protein